MTFRVRELPSLLSGRSGLVAAAWLALGAAVGVGGAVLAQVAPSPISSLPHYAAPYVLLLVLIGASAPGRRSAAVAAAGCFLAFVLAYYFVVRVRFGAVPVVYAGAWGVAALTVCPVAAAVVRWARSLGGVFAAAASGVAGAVALSDGAVGDLLRVVVAGRGAGAVVQPFLALADLLVVAIALVVVPRGARTRWSAIVLLVPLSVVATCIGWVAHFGPGPYL